MGLFGPSAFEEAVFRQMDQLMSRSTSDYDEAMLQIKERKLAAIVSGIDPNGAQKKWIKQVRASIAYRRYQIAREAAVRSAA